MNDIDPDPELPRAIALAWGVAANPQRGPKRELSIEGIVETAVGLADQGGLGAVSMSSVASALGFTPMSLYRYVSAKDDLVLLMQEQGIGLPPESVREASGWREGLDRWAGAQLAMYREHPWLLDIPIKGTPVTPNNLAWLDVALELLAPTTLTADEKVSVSLVVLAQIRWQGGIERGYREASAELGARPDDPDALDRQSVALMHHLVTDTEYPWVVQALRAGAFGAAPAGVAPDAGSTVTAIAPPEPALTAPRTDVIPSIAREPEAEVEAPLVDTFRFGLDRVLDGIAHYLDVGAPPVEVRPQLTDPPDVAADKNVREARKRLREAEKLLRDARKREREALKNARDRLRP
jgi:AcrR family transcriptional regulator